MVAPAEKVFMQINFANAKCMSMKCICMYELFVQIIKFKLNAEISENKTTFFISAKKTKSKPFELMSTYRNDISTLASYARPSVGGYCSDIISKTYPGRTYRQFPSPSLNP